MVGKPKVFLFNAFLIFVTLSVVYMVRRRVFARILISVLWLSLGLCNGIILSNRVTPFNAQDFKLAKDALSVLGKYLSIFEIAILLLGAAAVAAGLALLWKKGGKYKGKLCRPAAFAGVLACAMSYVFLTMVAVHGRVVSNYFGNIAFAYEDYGFPYCFAASAFNTGISQPIGYTEKEIKRVTDGGDMTRFETARRNDELPNIIVVQLETYFDPKEIEWLKFSEDPIPNQRKLYEDFSSGYFKVPTVGAGTANTEFEVLTGMNMRSFGPGEYPYKTYVSENCIESAALALKKLGYGTCAIHNNEGNFYGRAEVYNNMGFDHFVSMEFMDIVKTTPTGWATDDILLPNILEAMDMTKEQDFIFTVSVQGHGDYPEEKLIENPKIVVSGVEEEGRRNAWEYYVNEVYEMDQFAGSLVKAIEERGEPSVVVFYGDHLPTMKLRAEDLKSKYIYNTNYVIWDNLGLEEDDKNISAYQLFSEVFERLEICAGTVFNYHQARNQSKHYLYDLEQLQYDLLYGKQYAYQKNGSPLSPGHMVMGLKDVNIDGAVVEPDGKVSITGDYFTKQSKIYINGEMQDTEFLSGKRLKLVKAELKEDDMVQIAQVGEGDTIFRTSDRYQFKGGKLYPAPPDKDAPQKGREAFKN